jgi:pyruvate formate lyase activating enzyme
MLNDIEGVILRIERTSIHDGPGLRTVLFLKGCPLSCRWCSSPESQRTVPEKGYSPDRCIGCGTCVAHCPDGALSLVDGTVRTEVSSCSECFGCVAVCPHDARKGYGQRMTVSQAITEISKDEIFFFHSGGGVTISGGECLLQPDFTAGVLKGCRLRSIDTAIETSLFASWQSIEKTLPFLNTIYVDIKHPNGNQHRDLVGIDNSLMLANLEKLDQDDHPFGLHLRIPLIPGVNDADDTLLAVLAIAAPLKKLKEIELLPYHRLGVATYALLGRPYQLENLAVPSDEYIMERTAFLLKQDLTVPLKVGGSHIV